MYKDSNCSCYDRSKEANMPKKELIREEKGAYEKLTKSRNRNHISFFCLNEIQIRSKFNHYSMQQEMTYPSAEHQYW